MPNCEKQNIEQDNLMENAEEVGNYLIAELRKIEEVKEVRGIRIQNCFNRRKILNK